MDRLSVPTLTLALLLVSGAAPAQECVVLLHGLARTANSMTRIEARFAEEGYAVANIDYPSRKLPVEELAPLAVEEGLSECGERTAIHFITHSLGGILVRYYLETGQIPDLGRVVMLAPPNQGSEVVDTYRNVPGFKALNGPAGMQLGTDDKSVPLSLGPVDFELGVIAGEDTFNPILSQSLPNPDDGKVSVERTRVDGMRDFVVVPFSHPFIMRADPVIDLALSFIKTGSFGEDPQ